MQVVPLSDWLHKKPLVSSICLGEHIVLLRVHFTINLVTYTTRPLLFAQDTHNARFLLCPIIQSRDGIDHCAYRVEI